MEGDTDWTRFCVISVTKAEEKRKKKKRFNKQKEVFKQLHFK